MESKIQESSTVECNTMGLKNLSVLRHPCDDNSYKEESSVNEELNSQEIQKCSPNKFNSAFDRYSHPQDNENFHSGIRSYECKEQNCSNACSTCPVLQKLQKNNVASRKSGSERKSHYVSDKKKRKYHKCPYEKCDAAFERKWRLNAHMCTHIKEKLYSCSEVGCDKAYTSIGHLRRHVASRHSSQPKMICEYICPEEGCKKVYKSLCSLKKHYVAHHERNHLNDSNFANHKWTDSERTSYKCDKCDEHFTGIGAWKKHTKTHLTFKCDVLECSEEFSQFALLKKHKKFNHRESFLCLSCNKKFASKRYLQVHEQSHLLTNDKKLYLCPYSGCTRVYTRMFNLDQHIRIGHRDIKFQCSFPGCGKRLATKQKLQNHMNLHDPAREPVPRKQIARRQRKDAGKPKRSMAVKLSGVDVPYVEEKKILCSATNCTITSGYISACDDDSSTSQSEIADDGNCSPDTENWSELSEVEEFSEP